ncbi:hypothetical protein [Georgenia sp. Marseille-Q6866]
MRAGASPLAAADVAPASTAVMVTVMLRNCSTAPTYTRPVAAQSTRNEVFSAPVTVIWQVPS